MSQPMPDTSPQNYRGDLCLIEIDGQRYECTGSTLDGLPVYCKFGDFRRACLSFGDELLYVLLHDGRMIPRKAYCPLLPS